MRFDIITRYLFSEGPLVTAYFLSHYELQSYICSNMVYSPLGKKYGLCTGENTDGWEEEDETEPEVMCHKHRASRHLF